MSFCYWWFKGNWFSSDKCQTRVNYNYNFFILYYSPNDTKKTWFFNFCNDTQYYKQIKDENNKTKLDLFHDSQIVYKYGDEIIRLTGGFYKNKKNGKVIDINKKSLNTYYFNLTKVKKKELKTLIITLMKLDIVLNRMDV